jgi:hypothetical protein
MLIYVVRGSRAETKRTPSRQEADDITVPPVQQGNSSGRFWPDNILKTVDVGQASFSTWGSWSYHVDLVQKRASMRGGMWVDLLIYVASAEL